MMLILFLALAGCLGEQIYVNERFYAFAKDKNILPNDIQVFRNIRDYMDDIYTDPEHYIEEFLETSYELPPHKKVNINHCRYIIPNCERVVNLVDAALMLKNIYEAQEDWTISSIDHDGDKTGIVSYHIDAFKIYGERNFILRLFHPNKNILTIYGIKFQKISNISL